MDGANNGERNTVLLTASVLAMVLCMRFLFRSLGRWQRGSLGISVRKKLKAEVFRHLLALPEGLYRNLFTAWLGFPAEGFVSSDYFGLLPWIFLFWTGLFLYRLHPGDAKTGLRIPGITAMGRHSLLVYLLHQPIIYGVLMLLYGI